MAHDTAFWERMLPVIRSGDPDEMVSRLQHLLRAEPFLITPRHWLAEIHRRAGQTSLALGQYDRLFPLAVGAGDVFRALAVQKRLDELDPRSGAEVRFTALQRWFRLLGPGHLLESPGTHGAGLSARALLDLPPELFVRAAARCGLESFEREARLLDLEGEEQFVVLFGEFVWDLRLEDGRRRREERAHEGMRLRLDPEHAPTARLRVRTDTPCECLRFGASLMAELSAARPGLVAAAGFAIGDFVREERVMLPTRPLRHEDIDRRAVIPSPRPQATPPRLVGDVPSAMSDPDAMRDIETWVGYGSLTLDDAPADLSGAPPAGDTGEVRELDLDVLARGSGGTRRGRPVVEPAGPLELGDGLVVPPVRDPFAEPPGDIGEPIERRDRDRSGCAIGGRLWLMGMTGAARSRLECRVFDVSLGGVGLAFERERLPGALAVLEHEVLRVELDLPGGGTLGVAARMRWVEPGSDGEVRAGLQFVLLAPTDRDTLARFLGAPPAPPAG